ncbi:hypothetical protein [Brevundimonas sp.]|uniref:hypothetical protein n=2 Tax=unclassified Brevundimonas TaxID=2622653 RepID=UPI00289AE80F|nr:hypothetical protein [Brevundimonas sp.]
MEGIVWFGASIADWIQALSGLLAVAAAFVAVWATFAIFKKQSEADIAREQAASEAHERREQAIIEARLQAAKVIIENSTKAVSRANTKLSRSGKSGFHLGNIPATEDDILDCHNILQSLDVLALPSADIVTRVIRARYWVLTALRRTQLIRRVLEAGEDIGSANVEFKTPLNELTRLADFSVPID